MEPPDAELPAGIHQHTGPQDVRLQEDAGILDRTVHVALRREVHDDIRLFLFKERPDTLPVADVQADEAEPRVIHDSLQRGKIPRVGQLVHADDPVLRTLPPHMENEIGTDEPGSSRHQDSLPLHIKSPHFTFSTGSQYRILPSATAIRCSP